MWSKSRIHFTRVQAHIAPFICPLHLPNKDDFLLLGFYSWGSLMHVNAFLSRILGGPITIARIIRCCQRGGFITDTLDGAVSMRKRSTANASTSMIFETGWSGLTTLACLSALETAKFVYTTIRARIHEDFPATSEQLLLSETNLRVVHTTTFFVVVVGVDALCRVLDALLLFGNGILVLPVVRKRLVLDTFHERYG
jgi:hypothetical protein